MCAVPAPDQPRAVSIGGGTGQPNSIRALHAAGCFVTAVVSMADDGGSTGLLRRETGVLPPGDIRKCLVAMAEDPSGSLARAFQHRFEFADNHALGNLLLTALTEETGSFEDAIAVCSRILGCHGNVVPSTLDDVILCGRSRDGMEFRGQATLGTGPCALSKVWLSPREPKANDSAVKAILEADIVVLGPGSLFTSIIPNILVPGILDALQRTEAPIVYVCSKADMQGETWGLTAEEYVSALLEHGLDGCLDTVLLHKHVLNEGGLGTRKFEAVTLESASMDARQRASEIVPVIGGHPDPNWYFKQIDVNDESIRRIEQRVPHVFVCDFTDTERPTWHSVPKLSSALKGVLDHCRSRQR